VVFRLELSTVDARVRLAIAIQIEPAQRDAALDRILVHRRGHGPAMPYDVARQAGVHGDDLHFILININRRTGPCDAGLLSFSQQL
jgi:hypothetical protein